MMTLGLFLRPFHHSFFFRPRFHNKNYSGLRVLMFQNEQKAGGLNNDAQTERECNQAVTTSALAGLWFADCTAVFGSSHSVEKVRMEN